MLQDVCKSQGIFPLCWKVDFPLCWKVDFPSCWKVDFPSCWKTGIPTFCCIDSCRKNQHRAIFLLNLINGLKLYYQKLFILSQLENLELRLSCYNIGIFFLPIDRLPVSFLPVCLGFVRIFFFGQAPNQKDGMWVIDYFSKIQNASCLTP